MQLRIEWPHVVRTPLPLALILSKIGQTRWVACQCTHFVCPTPLWPRSWTQTHPAQSEMVDCGNDRAVLQCTGLNVKLIFNVWHFTQIIRPQTWPWGIPQIAFSVPQQLWNYSSQRERMRGRRGGGGGVGWGALSLAKWSPSRCSGHPSRFPLSSLWYHDRRAGPNWKHLGSLEAVWNNHILCAV